VKDRIGNKLEAGDKVLVSLTEAQIFGFVSQMDEPGLLAVGGSRGTKSTPGRVLVSCVVALPVDEQYGMVAGLVKVYDAMRDESAKAPN
jgi:hypothetical protein